MLGDAIASTGKNIAVFATLATSFPYDMVYRLAIFQMISVFKVFATELLSVEKLAQLHFAAPVNHQFNTF